MRFPGDDVDGATARTKDSATLSVSGLWVCVAGRDDLGRINP